MPTVAAAWGYCGHSAPASWEADALAHEPLQLLQLLAWTAPRPRCAGDRRGAL